MVKASASRAEDPGFVFLLCRGDFSSSNHVSDIKKTKNNSTPVAILPGAWWYRVISGTGWSGVSILTERERGGGGGGGRERERGREGEGGREREKENPMIPTSKERYMSYRRSRN